MARAKTERILSKGALMWVCRININRHYTQSTRTTHTWVEKDFMMWHGIGAAIHGIYCANILNLRCNYRNLRLNIGICVEIV